MTATQIKQATQALLVRVQTLMKRLDVLVRLVLLRKSHHLVQMRLGRMKLLRLILQLMIQQNYQILTKMKVVNKKDFG